MDLNYLSVVKNLAQSWLFFFSLVSQWLNHHVAFHFIFVTVKLTLYFGKLPALITIMTKKKFVSPAPRLGKLLRGAILALSISPFNPKNLLTYIFKKCIVI